MAALGTCARPPRSYTLRLMDEPRPPFVFPPWSFARPARPTGREPPISEMLGALVKGLGLRPRRKSMRAMFAEARKIEALAEMMDADQSPEPAPSPTSPPRRLRRK